MSVPFLLLALVFKSKQLVGDAKDDPPVFLVAVAFTVALIGVLTAWLLGRQKRRASGFPGSAVVLPLRDLCRSLRRRR